MGLREERSKERAAKAKFEMTKIAAIAGCLLVAAVGIGYLIYYYRNLNQSEQQYEALRPKEAVEMAQAIMEGVPELPEETEEPEEEPVTCEPVYDFDELHGTNEDIYAWITVPGTQVDYPVLQSETDNYYLDRNLNHSSGYPGCIYTNKVNAKDFSDYINVLYGHNMKNDSMFGELHSFADKTFFDEHREILVYTEEKRLTYEVIAAVKFSDVYIPALYTVTETDSRDAYVEAIEKAKEGVSVSHMVENLEIAPEDKLISLSTCVSGERTRRYIVTGRLIEETYYEGTE